MRDNKLTLCYAYYENPSMLYKHIEEWNKYPLEAQIRMRFIIVDDGSPNNPAAEVLKLSNIPGVLDFRLFRIHENKPWNQNGARNLAMHNCVTEWALMMDADHILPADDAMAALHMMKGISTYYVPRRVWPDGKEHRRHPNTFLLRREEFFKCGGYDEDFCGWYGSDSVFRKALDTVATRIETDKFKTVLYEGIIKDANTQEWGRKGSAYHSSNNPKLQKKRRAAPYKAENPLRFTWSEVEWRK